MFFYMLYFVTMQLLSFFLIGFYYVSIKLFYTDYFKQLTQTEGFKESHEKIYNFFNGGSSGI